MSSHSSKRSIHPPYPARSNEDERSNSLLGDVERAHFGLPKATMAFSSPYARPYFPLETVRPDETNVPSFRPSMQPSDHASETTSLADVIGEPAMDNEADHTTVMVNVLPGIRGYVEPHVVITALTLIQEVLPKQPEEILDVFHMSVMGDIAGQNSAIGANESILEIQTRLSAAHLRVVALDAGGDHAEDQADLTIASLENTVRVRSHPQDASMAKSLALHTLLGDLNLSFKEVAAIDANSPAIHLRVDDVLVWLALTNTNAFHVAFRDTSLMVAGNQARYLSGTALKFIPIIDDYKARVEDIAFVSKRRLQLLTHVLSQHRECANDPPFIARMLFILRASPGHFRNTDSWKILSRFRYVLRNLPADIATQLRDDCQEAKAQYPDNAPRDIVESWSHWHWDVPQPTQTQAFRTLFSSAETAKVEPSESKATTLTFRSEYVRVAIESDKGHSDIVLEETSLGMENTPPRKPEGLMLVDENMRTKTVLQMHTNTIAFAMDWGLFHIAEDVLTRKEEIEAVAASLQRDGSRTAGQALEEGLARHDIHVVLSTDTGSVALQTINLRHVSRADGLKLALIGTTEIKEEELGQCSSMILNVDTAVTELHGPKSRIWQSLLTSPSLYLDHIQPASGNNGPATITLASAYEDLQIVISEQVPGMLHLVDTVILDEVAKAKSLVELAKPAPAATPASSPTTERAMSKTTAGTSTHRQPKLHVAVLSGNVHFDVALLSTLSYQLDGKAASVRIAPSLVREKIFSIDFDVGRQNHAFINTSGNQRHTQGLLDVPPINGHVGLELGQEETSVSVASTIEKIEVDAGAVQGVIAVVNRPEVQDVISTVKAAVQNMQSHIAEVFPDNHQPKPKKEDAKQIVAYDARLALLGVRISASTKRVLGRGTAEVEFGIGPVHAKASNRAMPSDIIPNVTAHVQDIGARLHIKERDDMRPCGNATLSITLQFSNLMENGASIRELKVRSLGTDVNVYPETAPTIVDVINHLQDRMKHLDLSKEVDYLRRVRDERRQTVIQKLSGKEGWTADEELPFSPEDLLSIRATVELSSLQAVWIVDPSFAARQGSTTKDVIFSIASIQFTTRGGNEARLTIRDMQLELTKRNDGRKLRSLNSALLPEVGFTVGYWSQGKSRSLAFKADGKPLDLRLESRFLLPVTAVQRSIEFAVDSFRKGTATWESTPTSTGTPRRTAAMFDSRRLKHVLVEADFAGAQVYMQGSGLNDQSLSSLAAASQQKYGAQHGRYGQFAAGGAIMHTTLKAPGFAFKLEYNSSENQPTLNAELMIDASANMLLPNVVPLALEVSDSLKKVMRDQESDSDPMKQISVPEAAQSAQKFLEDESLVTVTPARIFGKTKVDLGFRIAKQEFGLSCQPIARVDAKASMEDFYITMNTIDSDEHGHFFAISAVITNLTAQVKHVYSREPTFSYEMKSVVLSAMNNKHLSGTSGVSAVLNINPTHIVVNGKQFQDLLLFREIWLPPEIRNAAAAAQGSSQAPAAATSTDAILMQKYQSVAAAAAFPWNATVNITRLTVDLDLGQSIGKSSFSIDNLWASQKKSSNWEQNLCVGLDEMKMDSTGRMSGFIQLAKLGARTSIKWPEETTEASIRKTPLIQGSVGFQKLRAKAAFDYQAFAFGDIEGFDFLMYNVRDAHGKSDRLVAVLDCEKAYVFCTSTSPAQAVGLYQAFDRLVQDKQTAYMQSLKDIEKHLRRESTIVPTRYGPEIPNSPVPAKGEKGSPISLHTDVVVTMGAVCFGIYPGTFFDSQMLKLEANNIQARFAVGLENGKITSGLGMTLGQLQVALSSVRRITVAPKALEVSIDEVIQCALNAKGGTILRVPKVIASMQTWQAPHSNDVDYIFKSLFDGKIDVGWNLSRINFIKGMWTSHSRALASRLGKSLPESAVKITAAPQKSDEVGASQGIEQEKITAEINLPQSRYEYHALEAPVIETPQLRDMGEATPPLEWIGLHRDRLPNVTHQIIIVSLLEVCKEVEEAYEKILGSS